MSVFCAPLAFGYTSNPWVIAEFSPTTINLSTGYYCSKLLVVGMDVKSAEYLFNTFMMIN